MTVHSCGPEIATISGLSNATRCPDVNMPSSEGRNGSISKHTKSYHTIIKTYKIVTYNAQNLQNRPGRGQSKHTKAQHTKSCHTKSQGTKSFHTKRQWKINGINQSTHHTKPFHINLHHFVVLEMSIFSWIKTYNLNCASSDIFVRSLRSYEIFR